ncbi:MAG: hypothetical protein ABJQ39_03255 [Winogradskyella arenosi]
MKTNLILFLIVFITLFGCNNKQTIEQFEYKTKNKELIFLTFLNDSISHVDYLIFEANKDYETKEELNYFGLIQFEGKMQDFEESKIISEKIITNSLKKSNGENLKFPLDASLGLIFQKRTKSLTFNGELMKPENNLSSQKVIKLIKKHINWNGEKINLE